MVCSMSINHFYGEMGLLNRQRFLLHLKNSFGWTTNRKIVVFSVDDYGNVRLASKSARERLISKGLRLDRNRFDQFDSLDTASDLSALFEVLSSVKDSNGKHAVFSPFALPANIDFEKMEEEGYQCFYYEELPATLNRLPEYQGTWDLWNEGMSQGIFIPQFHGREHVNLKFLNHFLKEKHPLVIASLQEKSWAGLDFSPFPSIDYVSAFSFVSNDDLPQLENIIIDGLKVFERVFGFRAKQFNAPGTPANSFLEEILYKNGISILDTSFLTKEHKSNGKYKRKIRFQGQRNRFNQVYQMRNSVFEPTQRDSDAWINRTMYEIETAFSWRKPAVISSHRVNFCGHIDERNRAQGLSKLKELLNAIVNKWPDVEFMSSSDLGTLMNDKVENE